MSYESHQLCAPAHCIQTPLGPLAGIGTVRGSTSLATLARACLRWTARPLLPHFLAPDQMRATSPPHSTRAFAFECTLYSVRTCFLPLHLARLHIPALPVCSVCSINTPNAITVKYVSAAVDVTSNNDGFNCKNATNPFVDPCYTSVDCQAYALGMGWTFNEGNYATKGCYTYDSSSATYHGKAYFGLGGTEAQMASSVSSPQVRISCFLRPPPSTPPMPPPTPPIDCAYCSDLYSAFEAQQTQLVGATSCPSGSTEDTNAAGEPVCKMWVDGRMWFVPRQASG